ncbi:hypothetical protein [Sandaracinus amylolyticus]|uniref:Uncharacterized protein n=1 Tax=Sandaracinus amylolyticus TaxID=927083 RepID=A0A0F6WAC3_9BACT|nr:hypothetical protein [Sandaracinus amylolyticus]AKF11461.1 hypothetical protein DB32_008610 [Sandaracinus amylolyticus]
MAERALSRAVALLFVGLVTWPARLAAQQLEPCDAAWLDVDHVQAIVQVELAEQWDASFDDTVVRFEECASEQPRIVLSTPGEPDATLTLRLARVSARARTRLVALVIAELLRTRAQDEEIDEAAAVIASPEPAVTTPARAAEEPAPVSEPAPAPSVALALTAPGPETTLGPDELDDPFESPARPQPSPWRLGATLGARVFVEPLTLAALADVTLRFDRLLIAVSGAGTQLDIAPGTVRLAQLTGGVGVRVLEHRGSVRVGWDVRGDAGAALAAGDGGGFFVVVESTTYTWVLSASTQLEVVWPVGPIELGLTTDVGYQRGIVEVNSFGSAGLGGFFASAGLAIGWPL